MPKMPCRAQTHASWLVSSEVYWDWIQLIGRNSAHTTAGKGRARRMP
jgi:hypothetical protein